MVSTRNSKKGKEDEKPPTISLSRKEKTPAKSNNDPVRESSTASSKRSAKKRKNETETVSDKKKKTKGKENSEIDVKKGMVLDEEKDIDVTEEKEMDIDEKDVVVVKEEEKEEALTDEDDDENDSIDWETVQLPPRFEQPQEEESKPVYNDVEIVMEAPRPVLKKSHWEMAYQRNLRSWVHNCHVLLLIAHYKLRNKWCSQSVMKDACSIIIPSHVKQILGKDLDKSTLTTGIKWLFKWWSEYFTITGTGLITRPHSDFSTFKDNLTLRQLIDKKESDEEVDYIEDLEAFLQLLNTKSGTRDTSAELFVAILRACGCEARLVCSLQPVAYKIPAGTAAQTSADNAPTEENEEGEKPTVRFKYRAPSKTYVDPNDILKQPRAKPPTVWAEVYCTDTQSWMCVDPIRGHIDKPLLMEPAALNRSSNLSFVIAFDPVNSKGQGNITDVTRRYTSNLEKAIRSRERPLTKREIEGGLKLWSDSLIDILSRKNKQGDRELIEQAYLDKQQSNEVMPTAIGNFKNHPLYALERHLLKFEILYPKTPILGKIRGETIYPRECVKNVSTADTYRKLGREIIEGEQPIKMVKANAVTIEKRRMLERAKQEGHDLMVPCYGEWQTRPYVPPPVIDGKIVKNAFGNIDLFTPSMLPKGAAHIPIKGIAKMAKKFGIDYADAVVDFEFVKMRSVPVIDGIVVAEHSKNILLEAWEEHDQNEAMKAIAKQEKEVYVRWRKLIKGLLIKARVDNDYGKTKDTAKNADEIWSSFHDKKKDNSDEDGGGGFLPEDGGGGGGFLPEDGGRGGGFLPEE